MVKPSLFPYFGGKYYQVNQIIRFIPHHYCYCEPFAGSAILLFNKPRADFEVINDINKYIANFYKVVIDKSKQRRFLRLASCVPYSEELFYSFRNNLKLSINDENDIEVAFYWYYIQTASIFGITERNYFKGIASSYKDAITHKDAFIYRNSIKKIKTISGRLSNVLILNQDFEKILKSYSSSETFFYLDPPYLLDIRIAGNYQFEMTRQDHERLFEAIVTNKSYIMLSHYECEFYDRLLAYKNWHKHTIKYVAPSTNYSNDKTAKKRPECIYMNYNKEICNDLI